MDGSEDILVTFSSIPIMSRSSLTRLGRLVANRRLTRPTTITSGVRPASTLHPVLRRLPHPQLSQKPAAATPIFFCSSFSTSRRLGSPLAPDVLSRVKPAELTDTQYHELSDQYLDNLLNKFEAVQDEREDIDIEYSVSSVLSFCLSYLCPSRPSLFHVLLTS